MRELVETINEYPGICIGLGIYLFVTFALTLATIESIFVSKKNKPF